MRGMYVQQPNYQSDGWQTNVIKECVLFSEN